MEKMKSRGRWLFPVWMSAFVVGAASAEPSGAVDIDVGRQLFVDDALVRKTEGIVRHWNRPVKEGDPIIWPMSGAAPGKTDGSSGGGNEPVNLTAATDGGLWWDPTRRKFRLWYQADWLGDICYAESADGRNWTYPDLGIVPGTNRIFEKDTLDSWCISPDYAAENPYASWKLHISDPGGVTADRLWTSKDGLHFDSLGVAGRSGDRSTSYYDPFRRNWVFSLRDYFAGRSRRYFASRTFGDADCRWRWPNDKDDPAAADAPVPEKWLTANIGERYSLYSFNAVAYESVMLGVMEVLYGTPGDNDDFAKVGLPKQTGLHFCFSRDGKTFVPRKEPDIAPSGRDSGKWDAGYLSAVGGICVIRDERLWFYYSGLRGDGTRIGKKFSWERNGMYSNGAIGVASLRRDGFAGMVAAGKGTVETKPLVFTGKHLFVNAECRFGTVAAEVLDEEGRVVEGYAASDCRAMAGKDSTKTELTFAGGDLGALAGRPVRIRFHLKCATLYSFWVSPSRRGESRGYVAAGGPDYPGLMDVRPSERRTVPRPPDAAHARSTRRHEGIPSLAVSAKNGRMWCTWYGGPTAGEDSNNYVVLATSADGGTTWREVLVADPDGEGPVRAFDPEVWIAPDGRLRWTWSERVAPLAAESSNAYSGCAADPKNDRLMMAELDAENTPAGSPEVRDIARGVMMCKPTVRADGTWLLPVSHWYEAPSACVVASADGGKMFTERGGVTLPRARRLFDEHRVVELRDGRLRCYMRVKNGPDGIWEAESPDGGHTWGEPRPSVLKHTSSRFFVTRLASGSLLFVKNGRGGRDEGRMNMTAYLSDDDGRTWPHALCLGEGRPSSYPDGQQLADGRIAVAYDDNDRLGKHGILFSVFREEDVRAGRIVSPDSRLNGRVK